MINLIESVYALRILWIYIKCLVCKYDLKYLIMPISYLLVIMIIVPSTESIVNIVTHKELSSYTIKVITKEDKVEYILEQYELTEEQFNVLSAIVLTEAQYNSYEDAYAVINTIYNRTHSKNWVTVINNRYGKDKGTNLYYQAIAPRQFVVYEHGSYKKNLNNTDSIGYDAIIDFLYSEEIMHNYLSFRSHNIKIKNSESFSNKGNNYFNPIQEKNRI